MSRTNEPARPYSLRRRLLVGMGAGFMVVIALVTMGIWSYARKAANQAYDLLLAGASLAILERTFGSAQGFTVDLPYSALEMIGLAADDRVFYRVFVADGATLTGEPDLPVPARYSPAGTPHYFDAPYSGEKVRFVLQGRRMAGDDRSTWVVVQLGHTRRARDALEVDLIANGLAVLVLVTAIGLIFVWTGIGRALRPLAGIERNLRARDPTDLTPLEASPPREVESLIGSINGFVLRLKNAQENAQTFIADVAHQIRTSLSALQGQLDLAARQDTLEGMRERLRRSEEQSRRTIRLTNQLLAHAMVIHRADNQPPRDVAMIALVKGGLEEILRDTITRNIDFELIVEDMNADDDIVAGNTIALREALRNLLDNAVKHGPESNRIDISLAAVKVDGEAVVRLAVEDAGPGIPADRRADAVKRFQSLGSDAKGSGLGLAIVGAVVNSHHGAMRLGDSRHGGLRVEIDFPARGEK